MSYLNFQRKNYQKIPYTSKHFAQPDQMVPCTNNQYSPLNQMVQNTSNTYSHTIQMVSYTNNNFVPPNSFSPNQYVS